MNVHQSVRCLKKVTQLFPFHCDIGGTHIHTPSDLCYYDHIRGGHLQLKQLTNTLKIEYTG